MRIFKMPENDWDHEETPDEIVFTPKKKIDRAKIVGVQKNDTFVNVLIDVPAHLVKSFMNGHTEPNKYEEPFTRSLPYIVIEYTDQRKEQFVFDNVCGISHTIESTDGRQLAVFLFSWAADLKETEFEIVEDIVQVKKEIKDVSN